ncbi:MAG: DUF2231 domain-containing protein [Bacteroidia bacterium]|nr:DUF2231 domain-containing protein [Bacteroidia bacterium]
MPPVHPLIVHIPIGSLLLAGIFFALEFIFQKEYYRQAGFIALLVGVLGIVGAIISGNVAEESVPHEGSVFPILQNHATLGWVTAWIFAILAGWCYIRLPKAQPKIEKIAFLLVLIIGYCIMAYSAHLGGTMVYLEGAGVAK